MFFVSHVRYSSQFINSVLGVVTNSICLAMTVSMSRSLMDQVLNVIFFFMSQMYI